MNSNKGFGLVETIVAMAIFIVLVSGGAAFTIPSLSMNRLSGNVADATLYAAEGIEAARSIRNQGWTTPFLATSCTGGCGISATGGFWTWNGLNTTKSPYTRTISVSDVSRDGSGNVVASGGTSDANTKKITSTVNWNFTAARPETITLIVYLTNWVKSIIGNWANPTLDGCVNISGNQNAISIAVSGNYAYVITSTGTNNFIVIDISNTALPSVVTSLSISTTATNLVVSGNYAYVTSSSNTAELTIINITTPAAPTIASTVNLSGNQDAMDVAVVGNYAFIVRANTTGDFAVVDVTNKVAPVASGTTTFTGNGSEIVVVGNYAYVVTSDTANDVRVVNISTPTTPSLAGVLNITGTSASVSVTGAGSTVYVGQANGTTVAVNVITPTAPSQLGTFSAGGQVNGLSLGNSDTYLFMGTANSSAEFRVLNVTAPESMASIGILNMTSAANDVVYVPAIDRAVVATANTGNEVCIVKPN